MDLIKFRVSLADEVHVYMKRSLLICSLLQMLTSFLAAWVLSLIKVDVCSLVAILQLWYPPMLLHIWRKELQQRRCHATQRQTCQPVPASKACQHQNICK